MSIDITKIAAQGKSLNAGDDASVSREQIVQLAQQFEAMLMTQMLREMRRSMLDEEEHEEDSFGGSTLTDTADIEFAQVMARSGGIGLTDALLRSFEQQVAGTSAAPQTPAILAPEAALSALPVSAAAAPRSIDPVALTEITAKAPISSQFGWRQDPMTGAAKFHNGVDIAVAYGREVKAAAAGTVAFSGVQSGYGNTVVIDHADGRQTRYAHLSEQLVRAGDSVAEGQIVGKSGNSGRSTGPHLHFEMLVNGRPVDPTSKAVGD